MDKRKTPRAVRTRGANERGEARQTSSTLPIQVYISWDRDKHVQNYRTIENTLARNLGHVCRMFDGRLPKQILFGELSHGQRYSGGQLKGYKDIIHSIVKKAGIKDT